MRRRTTRTVVFRSMGVVAVLTALPFVTRAASAEPAAGPAAATTNPSAGRFCNTSSVQIPNTVGGTASVYPLSVQASGVAGTLSKVTVELSGLSHQFPDDLDVALTGPNGASLVVLSDVGGTTAVSNLTLVLDSTSSFTLPDSTALSSGTFRPTDFVTGDAFPAPGPVGPSSALTTTLPTAFANSDPNGVWSLWIVNDSSGSTGGGSLSGGFCVNLTTNQPALTISKTHVGDFARGQVGAEYSVVVGSSGPGSTAGTVTVVDTPPTGMTVTGLAGTGWSCVTALRTCTRSDALAADSTYPPITVTVDVATNASSPLVNSVSVSGGGASGATASDSTTITGGANLTIDKSTTSTFIRGGTASYSLRVDNSGTASSAGTYTVTDTLPDGLTVAAAGGDTWDCSPSSASVTCTRSVAVAPGASAPVITVDVTIAADAPGSVTNTATVSGGGDANTTDNSSSVTSSVGAATQTASVTIGTSPPGLAFVVDGVTYTAAQTFTFDVGSQHTVSTVTPQLGAPGTRYVFDGWSNGEGVSHTITVTGPASLTAAFRTQHLLTTSVSPAGTGTILPATGYVDAGPVQISATPASGYELRSFSGAVTGTTNPQVLDLTGPATVTAEFATAGSPVLSTAVIGRTGQDRAQTWTFRIANEGTAAAVNTRLVGVTFGGGRCSPQVRTALPSAAATLAPGASRLVAVIVDVRGCRQDTRVQVTWTASADGLAPLTTTVPVRSVATTR